MQMHHTVLQGPPGVVHTSTSLFFLPPLSQALVEYRSTVLFHLSSLTMLDRQRVTVEEKVLQL